MRYIVIGGGISGLSIAQLLRKDNQEVIVLEAETRPGGMIKCDLINGSLFHRKGKMYGIGFGHFLIKKVIL